MWWGEGESWVAVRKGVGGRRMPWRGSCWATPRVTVRRRRAAGRLLRRRSSSVASVRVSSLYWRGVKRASQDRRGRGGGGAGGEGLAPGGGLGGEAAAGGRRPGAGVGVWAGGLSGGWFL